MALGLVIDPGSTSTKFGVFEDEEPILAKTIQHSQEEFASFNRIIDQCPFRSEIVLRILHESKIDLTKIQGVIGIGGLLKAGNSGVYEVNGDMIDDLSIGRYGEHAANLGALISRNIAQMIGVKAYIADPITTDEMQEVARLSGLPEIRREGRAHTLNQKSIAARASKKLGKSYEESRLIVAHLGGGISIVAHLNGKMIDTNSARGEGPFCVDRTGGLNSWELAKLCFSGKFTKEQMLSRINGDGGIVAYLGTRDFREVIRLKVEGDQKAGIVFDALAYQVAKEIGAMAAVLKGKVDAVVITGGMANSEMLVEAILDRVSFIGPSLVYPGENELEALAAYLSEVLSGKRSVEQYSREV